MERLERGRSVPDGGDDDRYYPFHAGGGTPQPNRSKVFGLCHGSNPHGDLV